jgi:hypothetical protein
MVNFIVYFGAKRSWAFITDNDNHSRMLSCVMISCALNEVTVGCDAMSV